MQPTLHQVVPPPGSFFVNQFTTWAYQRHWWYFAVAYQFLRLARQVDSLEESYDTRDRLVSRLYVIANVGFYYRRADGIGFLVGLLLSLTVLSGLPVQLAAQLLTDDGWPHRLLTFVLFIIMFWVVKNVCGLLSLLSPGQISRITTIMSNAAEEYQADQIVFVQDLKWLTKIDPTIHPATSMIIKHVTSRSHS